MSSPSMSTPKTARLLIVDDEEELMVALREMLAAHGYETVGVSSGAEALRALRQGSFDVLLTDLMMPEMDGMALLRAAQEIDPHLVVIMMTGQGTISTAVEAMKAGAFDYVLKPFKLQVLLAILPRALEMRRLRVDNVQLQQIVAIHEMAQAIAHTLDPETILRMLADVAMNQLGAAEMSVLLPSAESKEYVVAAIRGPERASLLGAKVPVDKGLAAKVIERREPRTLSGPVDDPVLAPLHPRQDAVSTVSQPMLVGGKLVGLVNLIFAERARRFTAGDAKGLSILAGTAAAALESAALLAEVCKREAAIKDSAERFRLFMDNNLAVAFMKDDQGRYHYINQPFERAFHVTLKDLQGKTDFELWPPDVAQRLREVDQAVLAENKPRQLEEMVPTPYGTLHPWLVIKFPFPHASGKMLGGLAIDIADLKQAQEENRQQAMLLDKARDAIYLTGLDGRIRFWNHSAERLYGIAAPEAVGQPAEALFFKRPPHEWSRAQTLVREAGEWMGELLQLTRAGKDILVESRWTLVRDDQGQPRAILVINTDITERKQLENQYLRAQRMESIGTLAGGIAHDLNNVLTPITMAAELLRTRLKDTEHAALLQTLHASALRGAEMVKQVLAFARGAGGQRRPLALSPLLKETAKLLKYTFPKTLDIQFSVPPDLWLVSADATQLHQMLMNLCVNARDAMPGGGRLRIAAENKRLDEQYARMDPGAKPGPYVQLTVADSGCGIPRENLDKIFDPFFTTKETGKGTGLGLSTVMGIVRSHGGFIQVHSAIDQGTEFFIFLPALESPQTKTEEPSPQAFSPGHGELILVVDDEPAICQITKHTLESYGYRVLVAQDGSEAVALFARQRGEVKAVLTDMVMPIMDGWAAIQALRKMDPNLRVIAASGWTSGVKAAETAQLKINGFLIKPYTANQLLSLLGEVLSK